MTDDDAWFAPKSCGYGSGLPIAWQGWALLAGYIMVSLAASLLTLYNWLAFALVFGAATAAFTVICSRKTRDGWRWRWRGKD